MMQEFDLAPELGAPAESCVVCFPGAMMVLPGQRHPHVLLAKAMLAALGGAFPELSASAFNDLLDDAAAGNLRHIQRCAGLPETGVLDKPTWNRLCRLYRAMFDRYRAPSQG